MTHKELKALDSQYILHTYGRNDVDIDHGTNATLYDLAGKEYIDFCAGIGVNSVGTANEAWQAAISAQIGKLGHISNLFYTQPCALLAQKLCERSGMAGVFFGNSGAEGNEGIIKLARKYSYDKYGKGRSTILTLTHSFHGRTVTTLAATGQDKLHDSFFPFTEGFRYAEPTMDAIQAAAGDDVCAVLVELVQGEGGVNPLDQDFVTALDQLCHEKDWLLLCDEVQCGLGRTGSLFTWQQYGVKPAACSFAKGIAGGLPMGGFLVDAPYFDVMGPGTHGSTFGGNPVSAAAACAVLDILTDQELEQVKEKGAYIKKAIEEMALPCLGAIKGMGLMLGIDVKPGPTNKELCTLLIQNGLLALTAGPGLRFLPPLTITYEEIDKGLAIFKDTLKDIQ